MLSAAAGFIAGLVHVFSGPDHLTAVAPLAAIDRRKHSWIAGAKWGAGHAAGVILIGVLLVFFRELLPMEHISAWSEQLVGLMLIAIGVWGIRLAFSRRLHVHEHQHEGESHMHIHCHKHPQEKHQSHVHSHAAFGIGTLHGLAGSSHFFGVLPALAFPTRAAAITYLAAYALGTIAGMTLFSSAAGWIGGCIAKTGVKAYRATVFSCSFLAVAVGVWWCAGH
ncbi:MAG: sulfite exporter TauE/SafE family protein [Verrucomicrobia bacterium]|nr:sulfite exporter TauE/SafE family protein [Verrucomicrobiota bacterium]